MRNIWLLSCALLISCANNGSDTLYGKHDLVSDQLAKTWDEGLPLGNGVIGALVWEKENNLRMSLDNVNLWDLRPMENLNTPFF